MRVLVLLLAAITVTATAPPPCFPTNPGCYLDQFAQCQCIPNCIIADPVNANCTQCQPGFILTTNGLCSACPANTFSDGTSHTCRPCSAGCYAPPSSFSCTCIPNCQSGTPAGCVMCNVGYQDIGGVCVRCPQGQTSNGMSCSLCPANTFYQSPGICTPCPPQYPTTNGTGGALSCCPAGMTIDPSNPNNCVPCPAGTFSEPLSDTCTPCPPGYISSNFASECIPCPAGSFQSGTSCVACDPSNCFSLEASTSCTCCLDSCNVNATFTGCACCTVTHCQTCADNTNCATCDPGYALINNQCQLCLLPHCTQCSSTGGVCAQCVPGYGLQGGFCEPCPPGTVTSPDGTQCDPCPPNTYQSGLQCVSCPIASNPTSSSSTYQLSTNGQDGATSCCPGGTAWNSNTDQCIPCAPDHYAAPYTGTCIMCPVAEGCVLIKDPQGAPVACNCSHDACQAGTYPTQISSSSSAHGACLPCPAGTYSLYGDEFCRPCPPNTYSTEGSSTCPACPQNTISAGNSPFCWSIDTQIGILQTENDQLRRRVQVLEEKMQNLVEMMFGPTVAESKVNDTMVFTDSWKAAEDAASYSQYDNLSMMDLLIDFQAANQARSNDINLLQQFDQVVSEVLVGVTDTGHRVLDPSTFASLWGDTPPVVDAISWLHSFDLNVTALEQNEQQLNTTFWVQYVQQTVDAGVQRLADKEALDISQIQSQLNDVDSALTLLSDAVESNAQNITFINLAIGDLAVNVSSVNDTANTLTVDITALQTAVETHAQLDSTNLGAIWTLLWRILLGKDNLPAPDLNADGTIPLMLALNEADWAESLAELTGDSMSYGEQLSNITWVLVGPPNSDAAITQGMYHFWQDNTPGGNPDQSSVVPITLLSVAQHSEEGAALLVAQLQQNTLLALAKILGSASDEPSIGRRLLSVSTSPTDLNFTSLFSGPFTPLIPLGNALTQWSNHISQDDIQLAQLSNSLATATTKQTADESQITTLQTEVQQLQQYNSDNPTFSPNMHKVLLIALGVGCLALLLVIVVAVWVGCSQRSSGSGDSSKYTPMTDKSPARATTDTGSNSRHGPFKWA